MTTGPFHGKAYHGGPRRVAAFRIDPKRGAYFTSDRAYALEHGEVLHVCLLNLERPIWHSEAQANADMEIDREVLIGRGHDGRIIAYDDGSFDYVAFHPTQIEVVQVIKERT